MEADYQNYVANLPAWRAELGLADLGVPSQRDFERFVNEDPGRARSWMLANPQFREYQLITRKYLQAADEEQGREDEASSVSDEQEDIEDLDPIVKDEKMKDEFRGISFEEQGDQDADPEAVMHQHGLMPVAKPRTAEDDELAARMQRAANRVMGEEPELPSTKRITFRADAPAFVPSMPDTEAEAEKRAARKRAIAEGAARRAKELAERLAKM